MSLDVRSSRCFGTVWLLKISHIFKSKEILLAEEVDWNTLRMDKDILNDMEYYEDTRSEVILVVI